MSADQPPTRSHSEVTLRRLSLPDVCSAETIAEHLGVPLAAIERALVDGHLPGRLIEGRWFIGRAALLYWIDSRADADLRPGRAGEEPPGRLRRVPGGKGDRVDGPTGEKGDE